MNVAVRCGKERSPLTLCLSETVFSPSKMKYSLGFIICFLSLIFVVRAREKYNFNSDWKVHVGDPDEAETPSFDDSD